MMRRSYLLWVLVPVAPVLAVVVSYEATSFPEEQGWERNAYCDPARWLEGGRFCQHVLPCEGTTPPGGQRDSYSISLSAFQGQPDFFVQWRVLTDGDRSEILGVAPALLSAGGQAGVLYHFTIAADQVRLIRDMALPWIYSDLEPGISHVYRLELLDAGGWYAWYVDGALQGEGVPEGPYPTADSRINFRAKSWYLESTTCWDYIRYGTIPQPGSGDYDSDGDVDDADLVAFQDCLLGPVPHGPGCSWADMNGDGITDGHDITLFVDALLAPPQPTAPGPGVRSVNFDARPGDGKTVRE